MYIAESEWQDTKHSMNYPSLFHQKKLPQKSVSSSIAQLYRDINAGGIPHRLSDDSSLLVSQERHPAGGQGLYARQGMAALSNAKLEKLESGIALQEGKAEFTATAPGKTRPHDLHQIWPYNKINKSGGENRALKISADCGRCAGLIMGSLNRVARYSVNRKTLAQEDPEGMKSEILFQEMQKDIFEANKILGEARKKLTRAQQDNDMRTTPERRLAIANLTNTINGLTAQITALTNVLAANQSEDIVAYYEALPAGEKERYAKNVGINEYANPDIGEGYTISSGGPPMPGANTWNYHWGGVVMKSNDNVDNATLENYATGNPAEVNDAWVFQIYGTKREQETFHYQHRDTDQHAQHPTTLVVRK